MELAIHIASYVGAAFGLSALITGAFALLPANKQWRRELELAGFALIVMGALLTFFAQAAEYAAEEAADESLVVVVAAGVIAATLLGIGVFLVIVKRRAAGQPE